MADMRKVFWGGTGSLIFFAIIALGLVGVFLWFGWGRVDQAQPWVKLQPAWSVVGGKTAFTLEAGDRDSGLKSARVTITQGNLEKVLVNRQFPPGGIAGEKVALPFTLEPKALGLKEGKARLTASVRDRSWREWFQGRSAGISREIIIDLVPLHLSFLSVNHLLHAGGTAVIRYHLTKPVKESGVVIEGRFFAGFPQPGGPRGDYVALVALPLELPRVVTAELMAKPGAGPPVQQKIALKVIPKHWRRDKMNLSANFLNKVAADFQVPQATDPLSAYLEVNREMRQANHARLKQLCSQSKPQPLWHGGFRRFLGKSMARFGDHRTYIYQGREVDKQVHLGEDLASLVHSPVPAANDGVVVLAGPLGIYGNSVVIDHGLGVFSLYGHLSEIDVKAGQEVKKGQTLGKTGTTGLAAGDHLHFSMLIQGEFVSPVEWWDPRWVKVQVEGQWKRPGAPAVKAAAAPAKAGQAKKARKTKTRHFKKRRPPRE